MSRRVILLADQSRSGVEAVLSDVREVIESHATLVDVLDANSDTIPENTNADMAVAIGGDGTLIRQALRLTPIGMPLVGINVGRLGFLAEFDASELRAHAPVIFGPDPPIQEVGLLDATVTRADGTLVASGPCINDSVITAGPPYRMIELSLTIDNDPGPALFGDGLIISTPSGSTAYNVSAGGPIVHPDVEALIITPIAAHSLAFRPLVLCGDCAVTITVDRANDGTTLLQDGQVACTLQAGDRITITRPSRHARFVLNPQTTYWRILQDKLRWAAPPNYRR